VDFDTATAPPAPAINPYPVNGDTILVSVITLSWEDCVRADTMDVYLWEAGDTKPTSPTVSGCTENSCTSPVLNYKTTYIWQVAANNANGRTYSDTWSFTNTSVYFADANLKARVETTLGITDPTPTDMLGLTTLDAWGAGISDLTGLEYALNFTDLALPNNQIIDLIPLSGLTNLTSLNLNNNQVVDIFALFSLTNLTDLYLDNNQIIDIFDLSGLTNLETLHLLNNHISDGFALSGLINLEDLTLSLNQISDISALSGLTTLTYLNLDENQIIDISALSSLTNLDYLSLNDNQIIDVSALVDNPGLGSGNEIYLDNNPLGGQAVYYDIPILEGRGATVYYDNPVWVDSDIDGMHDLWEEIYDELHEVTDTGVMPLDPFIDDADMDNDGDGKSNIDEYNANTDPTAAADLFEIYSIECVTGASSDTLTVYWYKKPGMYYLPFYTDSLEAPVWTYIYGYYNHGDTASKVDIITPPGTKRYYKVEVRRPY